MEEKRARSRGNEMIRCEVCNEDYSATYKRCPFCDERPRVRPKSASGKSGSGKRVGVYQSRNSVNPIHMVGLVLSLVIIIAAFFIIFKAVSFFFTGNKQPQGTGSSISSSQSTPPAGSSIDSSGAASSGETEDPSGSQGGQMTQIGSITLSHQDITLLAGETVQLTATVLPSGSGTQVIWSSSDETVATVSSDGMVTNVNTSGSKKMATITATCGDKSEECTVRCNSGTGGGDSAASNSTGTVTGAGTGLNVRSGPGTSYESIASLPTGTTVTILEDAGNGWYKISFSGQGGQAQTGYVSKDFIS